jgi:4'-phosphopantetheinyl transferase EntD
MSPALVADSPQIAALFALPVYAAELRGVGDPGQLLPTEAEGKERWAEKRIREFAAGRQCVRHALLRMGRQPTPLLALPDRRPAWPDGVTGSITHCAGFAAAVVAATPGVRSLGLDVEVSGAVDEHLWPRVLNAGERTWLQSCAEQGRPLWATVIFSAKEAFYKCQYPVTGQWLEFEDAHVELGRAPWSLPMASSAAFSITVTSSKVSLSGRGQVTAGYVCTAFSWP